jgi:septum formation protein
LILASASPRRKQLLADLGFSFEVMVRPVDETVPRGMSAPDVAEHLAYKKASAFKDLADSHVILAADTIVVCDDQILGKPQDRAEALDMLRMLNGRTHEVMTGVCVYHGPLSLTGHELTLVHFADLTEAEMEHYVDTYKPYDKAGGYGIQEWIGMAGISGIEGDFYNVMGLPTHRVWKMLGQYVDPGGRAPDSNG